jgi:hypothetical protein
MLINKKMSKGIKYLSYIIIAIISLSKCQNPNQSSESFQSDEQLQKLVNCVNNTENLSSNLKTQILNAWINADGSIYRLIGELLLTQSKEIKNCIPNINNNNNENKDKKDEPLYDGHRNRNFDFDKIYEQRYNWEDFLKCLQDYINNAINNDNNISDDTSSVIKDLIEEIKEGNFLKALREQFRLKRFGNNIISKCSQKLTPTNNNNDRRRDHNNNENDRRRDHNNNDNDRRSGHNNNDYDRRRDHDRYNNNNQNRNEH